jgi:uncharacterized protein (TIGR03437 family)
MRITRWNAITRLLWVYPLVVAAQTAPNWTRQIPQNFPPARLSHAMAYDSAHGQVVVFGGANGYGGIYISAQALDDTWVWDGSNWTEKAPQTSPSARAGHSMAYDAAHGQVVMFGGYSDGVVSSDTWVWDGSNWTQKTPQTSPSARIYYAMAYDSAHGQTVLFGGGSADGVIFAETWVWDGSNWTQRSPKTSPPARTAHAMAYDSAHGQVVLFGGEGNSFAVLNDTWVWDGTNWTQKLPQNSPPPPGGRSINAFVTAMAYDSAHGQVVLYRGDLNETWLWDGSNWTQQSPQDSPQGRVYYAMAYDSAHSQVVLFGGEDTNEVTLGDTWTWEGGALSAPAPSIGSVVSASAYGGFSAVAPDSFVEIYGSNLALDTRGWTKADFTGNQAPTSLDGVEVSIAGQKAFVNYIVANPGQVNVELPSNIPTGAQQVTVTNKNGTSAPFNVTVNATEPGLLAPASFKIGGKQYVVAFHSDNVTYVLPEGAIAGLPSRPAKPGETIVMYGNGFGPVTPNIPAGELAEGNSQLVASLEILFGETSGKLAYYGLSPGLVGVYQFDVVVPAIPDNDLVPLSFKLGGVAGAQTLYTAVKE